MNLFNNLEMLILVNDINNFAPSVFGHCVKSGCKINGDYFVTSVFSMEKIPQVAQNNQIITSDCRQ